MNFRVLFPTLMLVAIAIVGCGGGSGGSSPLIPAPTATPHVGPTTIPPTSSPQTVTISGAGYILAFTLPAVTSGSAATVTATLQATPPAGVPVVQARHRQTFQGNPTGLVYLTLTSTATVGFASLPTFVWTLPSASVIPTGSFGYMAWYDPYVGQWQNHLGPGTLSGTVLSFPGVAGGITLNANTQYVYALTTTTQVNPTATPAPTPSAPPSSAPAYCTGYSTPVPNSVSSPQAVHIIDNSGTGAQVVMYLVTGADTNGNHYYLAANGQLTQFTTGATAPPLPLACFPGSAGGAGLTFELPPPPAGNANMGENLFIALANPGTTLPNPLTFTGSGSSFSGYSLDWNSGSYASAPFDYVETGLPNATTDTTQVDKVGLPIELSQMNPSTGATSPPVGFAPGGYDSLLSAMQNDPDSTSKKLLVSTTLNGRSVLARILNPSDGSVWGFPQDYFYNPAYAPPGYSGTTLGYLGYVLQQYQTSARLYNIDNAGNGVSGNYCASYDGNGHVLWYSVPSASCASPSTTGTLVWTMPVNTLLQGDGASDSGICQSAIFAMPWGTADIPAKFPTYTDFYLWKAMTIDFARGVALQAPPAVHPIGSWNTTTPVAAFNSQWPTDPLYSHYWRFVHQNMIGSDSYGIAYDEPGGYASTFTANTADTLVITIQNVPAYSGSTPTMLPPALTCP